MSFDLSVLGVKKNVPKVSFMEYSGLFISPAKFGKTTLASMMPNAITCAFEIGYRGQVMNVRDMITWDDFIEFIDKLEKYRGEIGNDVRIVAIDTVNKAYDKCGDYTLKKLSKLLGKKCTRPQDLPHGGFYPERDKEFAIQLDRLTMLGFVPFFTTHSKIKTVTPKEGGESYDIHVTTMEDRCSAIIMPLVDYILYGERTYMEDALGNKKPTRALTTKGDANITAGNRVYIDEDIFFESEDEAVEKFQNAFGKVVEARLRKAGITEDIKKIEEQQRAEKMKEVESYIKEKNEKTNEQLIDEIKVLITDNPSRQASYIKILAENGITSLSNPSDLDNEALKKALSEMV